MKLSIIIPAHNEEECIKDTIVQLSICMIENKIEHEILVIYDNCSDNTENILIELKKTINELIYIDNSPVKGYGSAVQKGFERFSGDAVLIYMADSSDTPEDVCLFYKQILNGYDCVFGSRFIEGGKVIDYPKVKYIVNRSANWLIKIAFGLKYHDITSSFKMYRAHVIQGIQPLKSAYFNISIEIPLKAIIRGYKYTVISNTWINRTSGKSKLNLREMGTRYFLTMLECLSEKWFKKKSIPIKSKN